MNTYLQVSATFQKQMLVGNLRAFSSVSLFLIQCLLWYFPFCGGKCVLHWYIGILSLLLLFPPFAVPGLVELAGASVSTHSQMLASIHPSPPGSTNIHRVPMTCQAWLYSLRERKDNRVLASLFPAPWANSSHLLCLHVFVSIVSSLLFVCYSGYLIVPLCLLSAN